MTVGTAATTVAIVAADKDKNVKIYGNYNEDEGYWFNKEKFFINVIADSQAEAERIARELSRASCRSRGGHLSILEINNHRLRPPAASILDSRYGTDIQFKCSTDIETPGPLSIFITTEKQENSERLAKELADEACREDGKTARIIKIDNALRSISFLVLDKWYASEINFICADEMQTPSDSMTNGTEATPPIN